MIRPPRSEPAGDAAPWVVKLGGSLACSPTLTEWLDRLVASAPLVVVPGGGPFADQVRRAQDRWRFDDAPAHAMALLAMEQYGLMLRALCGSLDLASTEDGLRGALGRGRAVIWQPTAMAGADPAIARDWSVSSDSLAAWLCCRLQASALVLVKSVAVAPSTPIDTLVAQGVVDTAFAGYAAAMTAPVWCLAAPADWTRLRRGTLVPLARRRAGGPAGPWSAR